MISIYGKTQAEVRKKLTNTLAQIDQEQFIEKTDMAVGEWLTSWQRDYIGNVKRGTTVNYELHLRLYISPLIGWGTVSVCDSIMKPAPVACNGSKATGLIVPFSAVHDILTGRRD